MLIPAMTCPACEIENLPTADACDCGYEFTPAGAAVIRGRPVQDLPLARGEARRRCPYCKETIYAAAAICPHCHKHVSVLALLLKCVAVPVILWLAINCLWWLVGR